MPLGLSGELYISGDGLANGYINNPRNNQQAFVRNKKLMGKRLYRTGDIVRLLPDKQLEIIGRVDEQKKIRGYRIELGEIELVYAKHKQIKSCCVATVTDKYGREQLALYFIPIKSDLPTHKLIQYGHQFLPDYMIPTYFITVANFTLTSHGKIDKRNLPSPTVHSITNFDMNTNEGDKERNLHELFASTLGIKATELSPEKTLYDYGGDSITVMHLINKLYDAGYKIRADELVAKPRIDAMIKAILTKPVSKDITTFKVRRKLFTATAIQQWYLTTANLTSDRFNQSCYFTICKPIDLSILEQAFALLIQQHDALQLRFRKNKAHSLWLATIDNSIIKQFKLYETFEGNANVSFNLTTGNLIYAAVNSRTKPRQLFISIHHIAVDAVSWQIILRDLEMHYQNIFTNRTEELRKPNNRFQLWASAVEVYSKSKELEVKLHYWRQQCLKYKKLIKQPNKKIDFKQNTWGNSVTLKASLSQRQTAVLLSESNKAFNTKPLDLIVCAIVKTITSSRTAMFAAINLEGHGRDALPTKQMAYDVIGWFTTQAPLIIMPQSLRINQLIKQVKTELTTFNQYAAAFSILKYITKTLIHMPVNDESFISLNYLGAVNQHISSGSLFKVQDPGIRLDVLPTKRRDHLSDLLIYINNDVLTIEYTHSKLFVTKPKQFLKSLHDNLINIIEYTASQQQRYYTPDDFPAFTIDQTQLDTLLTTLINPVLHHPDLSSQQMAIEDMYELSPLQQGIYFHSLKTPDSDFYHVQTILEIATKVNVDLFKQAWLQVLQHFDIFKTGFSNSADVGILQYVLSHLTIPWQYFDWSKKNKKAKQDKFRELLHIDRERLFDLNMPPLIRCYLVKNTERHYRLVLAYHHILVGGWSISLIISLALRNYQALCSNKSFSIPNTAGNRPYIEWYQQSDEY